MCAERIRDPDAVIVGSGIAGALIAKVLATAGKKVLILEAGEELPPDINGYMNRFLKATAKVPESPYPPELFDTDGNLTDPGTVNAGRPTVLSLGPKGSKFNDFSNPKMSYLVQNGPLAFASTYERINGGTSRHWLGTSLRFVPADFEMKSRYGRFVDWPIKYADLEKWYGEAEKDIGVSADVKDQGYLGIGFGPDYAYPMPSIDRSNVDKAVEAAMSGLKVDGVGLDGVDWTVSSTPAARNSRPYQDRRVCAGNTNCIPICPIQAKYDPSVTLAQALRTGRVDVMYKTVASQVLLDKDGRVSGIDFIRYDKENGPAMERGRVTGKIYILAGNAIETPRLLLMSKNERTPAGVANRKDGKGSVGKYLMDHPLYLAWALAPKPVWGYRGPLSTAGIEVCRDGKFRGERGAFRIEIGNEGWNFAIGDPDTTTVDFVNGINFSNLNGNPDRNEQPKALFGADLVREINDKLSRQFRLGFLVEQSPDDTNTVTLARGITDHLGLERPQINYDLSEYTKRGLAAARTTATAIFKKMGAMEYTTPPDKINPDDPSSFQWPPSEGTRIKYFGAGHVVGTCRMGTNPNYSVVNDMQRSWDHDNLYLVGSGTFPTVATANPTLTIAALCLRTADYIVKNAL
jgi:choline dehydrogenase-like flavoprotein